MWWDASAINGYSVEASDGPLGTVSDFLFSDDSWRIDWLVVDTGNWLSGRRVLPHPSARGQPDPALRRFRVKLTKQQIKGSPNISVDQPVSRQMEAQLRGHYSLDPAGGDPWFRAGAIALLYDPPLNWREVAPHGTGVAELPSREKDLRLRSIDAVTAYHVHANDGEIGNIEDILIEEAGWSIRYLKVDTRNWWFGSRVLVATPSVKEIDWEKRLVSLDVTYTKVKDGPRYDPSTTVDGTYNETFLTYYGIRWIQP